MEGYATLGKPAQIDFPGFEIEAEDTVVDVGCGDGPVCVYAGHRGAEVIGLDIEPALIARANASMAGVPARSFTGIVSDADPIPLPDGVASVVVVTEVLEHVDDPARILSELVRIGRPGARYLISVPDPASESIMRSLAPAWYFEKPIHVRVFEHETLDRSCAEAGLEVVSRQSSGFYFSMYWMVRMSLGMDHKYAEPTPHPAYEHLEGLFATILAAPRGEEALRTLDRLIPKSQVVIARKPGKVGTVLPSAKRPRADRPAPSPKAPLSRVLRDAIREGSAQLAGFDLRWSVRRSPKIKS